LESTLNLPTHFTAMGARLKVRCGTEWSAFPGQPKTARDPVSFQPLRPDMPVHFPFLLDIRQDRRGAYFALDLNEGRIEQAMVLDCRRQERHLVLMLREQLASGEQRVHRFLCGHDERDWFAAALPERAGVTTVRQAWEALKPAAVLRAQAEHAVPEKLRNRRRNAGFLRQGEWFFVPREHFEAGQAPVHRDEPLQRGAGKPHVAEELVRVGGETVYELRSRWKGRAFYTAAERTRLFQERPEVRHWGWAVRQRNMLVFVRGRITHPDHKTLVLADWHRVVPNTESRAAAGAHLVFVD
jgi:hypothetical protein